MLGLISSHISYVYAPMQDRMKANERSGIRMDKICVEIMDVCTKAMRNAEVCEELLSCIL